MRGRVSNCRKSWDAPLLAQQLLGCPPGPASLPVSYGRLRTLCHRFLSDLVDEGLATVDSAGWVMVHAGGDPDVAEPTP